MGKSITITTYEKDSYATFYRPEIDGLRGFAVVVVIINHFNKDILPCGHLGVDIFFVISGYVITSSFSKYRSNNISEFLIGFYTRRIKRLVPALVTFVIITSISICFFNPSPEISLRTGITSLFGFSNLYLLKQSADYFAASAELNVFTHTWSLGVEEQFYLIFPLIVWFTGFNRLTAIQSKLLTWLIGVLSITSLIIFIYFYQNNQAVAYFMMPSRFWELGAGCLTFVNLRCFTNSIKNLSPLIVVATIVSVLFLPFQFALPVTIVVVLLTSVFISCIRSETIAYHIFTFRPIIYIGLISYSLYLWHWGVLSLSRWTIGIHWWSIPFQIALILLLSIISYHYVEKPMHHVNWTVQRWRITSCGIISSIMTTGILIALEKSLKERLYSGSYPHNKLITRSRNNLIDETTYRGNQCHFPKDGSIMSFPLGTCQIFKGDQKFYFVGDSHADHFRTTHFMLAKYLSLSIDGITASTCVFPFQASQKGCGDIQKQQQKRILNEMKLGDVIVISNRYVVKEETTNDANSGKTWIEEQNAVSDLISFSKKVKEKGGKLILIAPAPEFSISIQECVPHWYRPSFSLSSLCKQSLSKLTRLRQKSYEKILQVSSEMLIYDPSSAVCRGGQCSMIDEDHKPLYVDKDHFTDYANANFIYKNFVVFLYQHNLIKQHVEGKPKNLME